MALANPNNLSVRVIKKAIVEVSGVGKGQHYGIKNNITTGQRKASPQEGSNTATGGGAISPREKDEHRQHHVE